MNLRIKLSLLDKLLAITYFDIIPVLFNNNPNEVIGTCQIFIDGTGKHFGDLRLRDGLSMDLYLYYMSAISNDEWYDLENLSLHSKPRNDKPTKTLKELVV